jgi:hypothetical protein
MVWRLMVRLISITDGTKANLSDFANLKSKTGYQKLPNGLILQWGEVTESIWN